MSAANVLSAPLAAGLLQLNGRGGLAGWQWLFLLEGCATVAVGVAAAMLLPAGPHAAHYLTPVERRWLLARLESQRQQQQQLQPSAAAAAAAAAHSLSGGAVLGGSIGRRSLRHGGGGDDDEGGGDGAGGGGLASPPLSPAVSSAIVAAVAGSTWTSLREAVTNTRIWYVHLCVHVCAHACGGRYMARAPGGGCIVRAASKRWRGGWGFQQAWARLLGHAPGLRRALAFLAFHSLRSGPCLSCCTNVQ